MPYTDELSSAAFPQKKVHAELNKQTIRRILLQAAQVLYTRALLWPPVARHGFSILLLLSIIGWFWRPLMALFSLAVEEGHYSHIVLIPWISLYALYVNRSTLLVQAQWNPAIGFGMIGLGLTGYWLADQTMMTQDYLVLVILAFVVSCWGIMFLSYGIRSSIQCSFSILILLCMVPLPSSMLNAIVIFLQRGSAEVTDVLFSFLGVPVWREGFIFGLSNFTIHIAEECSGIRSTLALLITSLVAGHFFLASVWGKIGLVAVVVPLAIIKNAFRIVGLSLLANYVDPRFITESLLHRKGGIPLFLLAVIILCAMVGIIRKLERRVGYNSPA
jgi:exosortase